MFQTERSTMKDISTFSVLRWPVPDSLKHLSPLGMKVFKFEMRDVIVVWFKSNILIYDNIKFCDLQNGDSAPGNITVSTYMQFL
jgi:hypothetical protein